MEEEVIAGGLGELDKIEKSEVCRKGDLGRMMMRNHSNFSFSCNK